MNTFINDKIASFTHDALLLFQQYPHLTSLYFEVNDVLLENMPPDSKQELVSKRWGYYTPLLDNKQIFIRFHSVPTI